MSVGKRIGLKVDGDGLRDLLVDHSFQLSSDKIFYKIYQKIILCGGEKAFIFC